jgi:hypothetical protein
LPINGDLIVTSNRRNFVIHRIAVRPNTTPPDPSKQPEQPPQRPSDNTDNTDSADSADSADSGSRTRRARNALFASAIALFVYAQSNIVIAEDDPATDPSIEAANTTEHSIARQWNDELLDAIRSDFARPTVHARNLFHTSIAMWDSWAAYDEFASNYLHLEKASAEDVAAARHETISFAVYRVLVSRFTGSPGEAIVLASFAAKMSSFGYDIANSTTDGDTPAALGNRIAATVLAFGDADTSNEANNYENVFYESVNPELYPDLPGNPWILDPNRWQALVLDFFVDQSGIPFPLGVPPFLSPEWGTVTPFALVEDDLTIHERDGNEYWLYHDPGTPPQIAGLGDAEYRSGFDQVLAWSALLDPNDGVLIDISPASRGNNTLGTNDGVGREVNPKTGLPYPANIVPAGDYYRVLAEFWADGPDSETPPGHWFTIANHVSDHPLVVKKIGGVGPIVDDLEWDVKLYQALAGAVHDAAVAAWGSKGWYDYIRPISAIRFMAANGQSSDPNGPSYHPNGITLKPGSVEVITLESVQPGERHAHLAGRFNRNVGKIAARAGRGPDYIPDPETTTAGVGWILVDHWWPYQRPSFVTPPFAGYVSGHSTFSRAAAELMTLFTGDPYFPGGVGEFLAPRNEFLVFEDGPSVDVTLQWATYRDASDETSISRIYGGIHPTADDIPGRLMGSVIGPDAFRLASSHWGPWKTLEVDRVSIRPSGKLFVRGKMKLGVYGQEDILDLIEGAQVSVTDKSGSTIDVELSNCQSRRNDNFRCRNEMGTSIGFFFHRRDEKAFRFWLVHSGDSSASALRGPLIVKIATGDIERVGISSDCSSSRGHLECKRLAPDRKQITVPRSPVGSVGPRGRGARTSTRQSIRR